MELQKEKLQRERIFLATLSPENLSSEYVHWMNDPEVNKYLESRNVKHTDESVQNFVLTMNQSNDNLLLGIFLSGSNKHIGNIKLGPVNFFHSSADIGLLIGDRASWGKGFASEAISLISDYGFNVLRLHKLTAGCYEQNQGSLKAFIKAGYSLEGRRLQQFQSEGRYVDQLLVGKVNPNT